MFAEDPECAAAVKAKAKDQQQRPGGGAAAAAQSRAMQCAGSHPGDELELRRLQVFVRIRPTITATTTTAAATVSTAARAAPRWEAAAGGEDCIHATSKHSIAIAPPEGSQAYKSGDRGGQTYAFTRVFPPDTPQQDYYEHTAAPLVRRPLGWWEERTGGGR